LNGTGLPRDLREGLSDKECIGEAEESEMGMAESNTLPNQIHEMIKSTWYQVNNHDCKAMFDKETI
jgi:hypothetical protein